MDWQIYLPKNKKKAIALGEKEEAIEFVYDYTTHNKDYPPQCIFKGTYDEAEKETKRRARLYLKKNELPENWVFFFYPKKLPLNAISVKSLILEQK